MVPALLHNGSSGYMQQAIRLSIQTEVGYLCGIYLLLSDCIVLSFLPDTEDKTVAFKTFYFSPLAIMVVR